jgi:hypothetical protein
MINATEITLIINRHHMIFVLSPKRLSMIALLNHVNGDRFVILPMKPTGTKTPPNKAKIVNGRFRIPLSILNFLNEIPRKTPIDETIKISIKYNKIFLTSNKLIPIVNHIINTVTKVQPHNEIVDDMILPRTITFLPIGAV